MTLYLLNVFIFKLILEDFNFGPYLHNQDDVIWSWPYYKKWLCRPTHDLSQYKIWTNLDKGLLIFTFKLTLKDLKFCPYLHNQDDVKWSWSYYKKWLFFLDLSAHKIWTNLDKWLLRYETKKNSACAHAHYECLAKFMMAYLDRVHGYERKTILTLYLLNVIFTFKLILEDLKLCPYLHNQDDVIWSCSYYEKWLLSHDLSAYKIWTNLDKLLLRYETKRNSACAHTHYEGIARFMTAY